MFCIFHEMSACPYTHVPNSKTTHTLTQKHTYARAHTHTHTHIHAHQILFSLFSSPDDFQLICRFANFTLEPPHSLTLIISVCFMFVISGGQGLNICVCVCLLL